MAAISVEVMAGVLMAVAVGGMLCSAALSVRRRRLAVPLCPACGRPRSRAYRRCRHCGAEDGSAAP